MSDMPQELIGSIEQTLRQIEVSVREVHESFVEHERAADAGARAESALELHRLGVELSELVDDRWRPAMQQLLEAVSKGDD